MRGTLKEEAGRFRPNRPRKRGSAPTEVDSRSDIDVAKWAEALSYINEMNASIIVPGHGSLGQAEIARALLVGCA